MNPRQRNVVLPLEDYLTPEERLNIVADILSDIALSILNETNHENKHHS